MRRRTLLKLGLGVPAAAAVGGAGGGAWWWTSSDIDTVGRVDFAAPLTVPPVSPSTVEGDGTRVFTLVAQRGTSELVPGGRADTWGYNGTYLGPTLRARVGEQVRVEVRNDLDESTTVHWHGMHIPARFDGGPHQSIAPGDGWEPSWRIAQLPATLWYHPHPHGRTEKSVYRGLAGMFVIDPAEDDGPHTDLPHEYGVDDIPAIVQDRRFDDDGELHRQHYGDTLLVNGTYGPFFDVTTEAVRLRVLNASTARVYDFGFSDDREFTLVGTDGGFLPRPAQLTRIRLSPAERAEIVVRLVPHEQVTLRSVPPELGVGSFTAAFVGGRDRFDVLQLRAAGVLASSPEVPGRLADDVDLDPKNAVGTRPFIFQGGRRINGKQMAMGRIDETMVVDTTEIWKIQNASGDYHNFHAHDVQFHVIDVDGRRPPVELSGWKDTVMMEPQQTIRLVVRLADYTDPDLPYMYHCHLLHHEDRGMMGQFVVVKEGEQAGTPPGY